MRSKKSINAGRQLKRETLVERVHFEATYLKTNFVHAVELPHYLSFLIQPTSTEKTFYIARGRFVYLYDHFDGKVDRCMLICIFLANACLEQRCFQILNHLSFTVYKLRYQFETGVGHAKNYGCNRVGGGAAPFFHF